MGTMQADERRFTWFHAWLITLAVALAGVALNGWRPLWLAPPNFQHTLLLYTVLSLLWLPLLVIFRLSRPAPSSPRSVGCLIGFALFILALYALFTTAVPAFFWQALPASCTQESLSENRIRYQCAQDSIGGRAIYHLEGDTVFARLVDVEVLAD